MWHWVVFSFVRAVRPKSRETAQHQVTETQTRWFGWAGAEKQPTSSPNMWKILCVHHPGLNCSSRISCSFQDVSFTRFWQSLEEEGCKMASTCRAACDPSSDMKAWKSQTLTAQGFHLKEMISTHRHGCCRCFSSKRKQHQNPGEVKREWEREHGIKQKDAYSSALWDGALLSGLSGCQAEAKDHHRPATKTADVKHLAFPSLSFSAFTHARSPGLAASTLDLISLSPLRCYGNQNLGITSLQLCDGSCGPILQPLLTVSPPEAETRTWVTFSI